MSVLFLKSVALDSIIHRKRKKPGRNFFPASELRDI